MQDRDPAHRNPAALAALERGDLDINTEIWLNSVADPWERAEKTGKVKRVGEFYMGGEAWYIPRYTAERLPELKSAADLPVQGPVQDPEEPGRPLRLPGGLGLRSDQHQPVPRAQAG